MNSNQVLHIKVAVHIRTMLSDIAKQQGRTMTELVREGIIHIIDKYNKGGIEYDLRELHTTKHLQDSGPNGSTSKH